MNVHTQLAEQLVTVDTLAGGLSVLAVHHLTDVTVGKLAGLLPRHHLACDRGSKLPGFARQKNLHLLIWQTVFKICLPIFFFRPRDKFISIKIELS